MSKPTKEEILQKLKLDAKKWNEWRQSIRQEPIEISDETISRLNLERFQFNDITFSNVLFDECNIQHASFTNSQLNNVEFKFCEIGGSSFSKVEANRLSLIDSKGKSVNFRQSLFDSCNLFENKIESKDFTGSEFKNIDMSIERALSISFSNIKIDKVTRDFAKKNPKITLGINGIYNQTNNTASLQIEKPKGDEMTGGNEDVILASLTKSKRAFTFSVSASLIAFTINFLGVNSFAYIGLKINPESFAIIALPIVLYSLYKCNILMTDVLLNIKYIETQSGAMKIGRFPWLLSRYWGDYTRKKNESLVFRLLYCIHPLLLLPIMISWIDQSTIKEMILQLEVSDELCKMYVKNSYYFSLFFWLIYLSCIYLGIKVLVKSQGFQKPILFDLKNPRARKNDLNDLANSVSKIEKVLTAGFGNMNFGYLEWSELKRFLKTKNQLASKELEEKKNK